MGNFLRKKKWTLREWEIFRNNIELLRLKEQISLGELNTKVGHRNLLRKDQNRIHPDTILQICQKFNISEKWLATDHITELTSELGEQKKKYKLHGDWQGRSLEDFCGVPEGLGFIQAMDVIADIFRTENKELINKTVLALKSLRDSGTNDAENITYMDPAVRIMNEILREEDAELDEDELAAVLEMLRGSLEKPKSNTVNLIRAFKKGGRDGGGKT